MFKGRKMIRKHLVLQVKETEEIKIESRIKLIFR